MKRVLVLTLGLLLAPSAAMAQQAGDTVTNVTGTLYWSADGADFIAVSPCTKYIIDYAGEVKGYPDVLKHVIDFGPKGVDAVVTLRRTVNRTYKDEDYWVITDLSKSAAPVNAKVACPGLTTTVP